MTPGMVNHPITGLPKGVSATLVDNGPDNWQVYRIADDRGYTKQRDTIRIGRVSPNGRPGWRWGDIELWRQTGWVQLLALPGPDQMPGWRNGFIDYSDALIRTVAVLYGIEDHG